MNYYEILEINENASNEVIKMAYKALILKYHPDTYKGDKKYAEEMTKKINIAFETLIDENKRLEYNIQLKVEKNKNNNFSNDNNTNEELKNNCNINKNNGICNKINNEEETKYTSTTNNIKIDLFSITIFAIALLIILISLIFSSIFNNSSNNDLITDSESTYYQGKIQNTIQCSSNGYIYETNSNEYWYTPYGNKIENTITILINRRGNYILKENNQIAFKLEKSYQSRINGTFEGFANRNNIYYSDRTNKGWFILENNQIWSQNDIYTYSQIIENPYVTLFFLEDDNSNGFYNGYYLCIDEIDKAVKVKYEGDINY